MDVILSHISALQAYRAAGADVRARLASHPGPAPRTPLEGAFRPHLSRDEAIDLARRYDMSLPIHTLSCGTSHREDKVVKTHLIGRPSPHHQVVDWAPGLRVSSPELMFLQMAQMFDLVSLVALGFEICGHYARRNAPATAGATALPGTTNLAASTPTTDTQGSTGTEATTDPPRPMDPPGPMALAETKGAASTPHQLGAEMVVYDLDPLTSVKDLERFAQAAASHRGVKRMQQALVYIRDGARSPDETEAAIRLGMPFMYGAKNLGMPFLGHHVALDGAARRLAGGRSSLACDLYFPEFKLDIECGRDALRRRDQVGAARPSDAARPSGGAQTSGSAQPSDAAQPSGGARPSGAAQPSCDRTQALRRMGVTVMELTDRELDDEELFDALARQIARRFHKRMRPQCNGYPQRCEKLLATLHGG